MARHASLSQVEWSVLFRRAMGCAHVFQVVLHGWLGVRGNVSYTKCCGAYYPEEVWKASMIKMTGM